MVSANSGVFWGLVSEELEGWRRALLPTQKVTTYGPRCLEGRLCPLGELRHALEIKRRAGGLLPSSALPRDALHSLVLVAVDLWIYGYMDLWIYEWVLTF